MVAVCPRSAPALAAPLAPAAHQRPREFDGDRRAGGVIAGAGAVACAGGLEQQREREDERHRRRQLEDPERVRRVVLRQANDRDRQLVGDREHEPRDPAGRDAAGGAS